MNFTKLLLLATSIFYIGCGGEASSPVTTSKASEVASFSNKSQQELLDVVNQARSIARDCHDGNGLLDPVAPLRWNDNLESSAYEHAYDLAYSNTFSHEGSGTESDTTGMAYNVQSTFTERIKANGYKNSSAMGENIAAGQFSLEEVMASWLSSPAHCAVLMNASFTEIGVATVTKEESTYGIYWTQNFGDRY
jgi:uncharacterized protein YkwD